ncbi:ABC transporter permease [Dehalococcoidia bacterium]|nr:ABC transporter permease [Dehalococcoidia bacterium]
MRSNRNGLTNIVRKEFIDHIRSGKFIIVFLIFLLLSAYSLHEGINMYHVALDRYKEHIERIEDAEDDIGMPIPPGTVCIPGGWIHEGWMPERPSPLYAFMWMRTAMPVLGAILAVVMGFDLISRERQDRTLKTLLSHPIYRDEIINGKAIAGLLVIILAIGMTFGISLAMLLISDIVPTIGEFVNIALFGIISVILLLSFFAIALMSSVLFKNSGSSIMFAFGIILVISLILPAIAPFAAEMIVGPEPEPPAMPPMRPPMRPPPDERQEGDDRVPEMPEFKIDPFADEEWAEWRRESEAYWERKRPITEAFAILSPATHFEKISTALDIGVGGMMGMIHIPGDAIPVEDPDIFDRLYAVWMNILALFVIPAIFFAIAYTKFMKLDIR